MADLRTAANEVKQCFDKIKQAKNDPAQLEQAINSAQQKVEQLVQQAGQS